MPTGSTGFASWFDHLQWQMQWRVSVVKQEDSAHLVVSHSGAVPPVLARANALIHNWKLAEPVDMWGTSFAPQAFSWDMATCAQVIEITRSAAGKKPFWISEMAGGAANIRGFDKSRLPRPKDMHTWNWLAAAMGSRGTVHWCYLTERTGQEAGGYGLVRLDGEHTPRSRAVQEVAARLKQEQDVLLSATVATQVAVLYDPDASSLLFAMEMEDTLYGNSHIGYYRAVWKSDLSARYVTPEQLDTIPEKVLLVPMALVMTERTAEAIARYVEAGGVLIAEARTGMFDSRGWMHEALPAGLLSDVCGVVEEEMVSSDVDNGRSIAAADGTVESKSREQRHAIDPIHLGPSLAFDWPIAAQIPVQKFLTPLKLLGARPIGRHNDLVLATHHRYGQGHAYYVGTYLGLALYKNLPGAVALVQKLLLEHAHPPMRGKQLRPRLLRGDKAALLIVFNDNATETLSEQIDLPEPYRQATNVATNEPADGDSGQIAVTLEAESVAVYRLETD